MSNLDSAFSALADPTRRAILARLALGEATVMELAEPFEMTQPAISRHIKVLEGAGLILRRVEGTKRPWRGGRAPRGGGGKGRTTPENGWREGGKEKRE
jgi:DNA-binding transcriptional ArsR family regulator